MATKKEKNYRTPKIVIAKALANDKYKAKISKDSKTGKYTIKLKDIDLDDLERMMFKINM